MTARKIAWKTAARFLGAWGVLSVGVLLVLGPTSEPLAAPRPPHAPRPVDWPSPRFSTFTELRGLGISAQDFVGTAVATSGTATVVGVPYLSGGRAYVYAETAGGWHLVTQLQGVDTQAGDYFGISVAISGTTIVVGANGHADGSGRAYIFSKDSGGWQQSAELTGTGFSPGAGFGSSVAISSGTVVVGAPLNDVFSGGAAVFQKSRDRWRQVARLTSHDISAGDFFGFSVALSAGNVAVGAPGWLRGKGRAFIFSYDRRRWPQIAALGEADGALGDNFGYAVGISATTVVVGAPWHGSGAGAGYVFAFGAPGWRYVGELKVRGIVGGDQFGDSVAIAGTTIVIGAPLFDRGAGEAYMFVSADGAWRQAAAMAGPATAVGDAFGTSVAIAGATVAVGASRHGDGGGAVYLSHETIARFPAADNHVRTRAFSLADETK